MLKRRHLIFSPLLFLGPCSRARNNQDKKEVCDLLVIGAGAAGLFAAISAKEAGLERVILIEKFPSPFFSSTAYSAGSVNASGTIAQIQHGVIDTDGLKEFEMEVLKEGNFKNDKHLVANYVKNAASTLDWLTEQGVELTPAENSAFRLKRMHGCDRGSGSRYVEVLFPETVRLGVETWFQAKAQKILTDGPNSVIGAKVTRNHKSVDILAKNGVILCTGGFAGDVTRIDKEIPSFAGAPTFSSPSSLGEGLDMARAIGASTHLIPYAGAYAYGVPLDDETRRGLIFRGHVMNLYGSITLNRLGKRFTNDDQNSTKVAQLLAQQKEKTIFQLATHAQLQEFLKNDPIQVIGWDRTKFLQEMEDGKYFISKAHSLEEVASLMKVPTVPFIEEINRYNRMVRSGKDTDFGRKYLKGQLSEGPFYLFKGTPVVGITIGGLRVNERLQVVNEYGEAIKNLFAAGEVVGGLHGTSYIGGTSLAGALTLGRLAGKIATKNHYS